MSAVETSRIGFPSPVAARARKFRVLTLLIGTGVFAYFLGAVLGAPTTVLSPFFSVFMAPVPFVGWWAYVRAPPELRRFFLLLAWAATFWLLGSLAWYGYYFASAALGSWQSLSLSIVLVGLGEVGLTIGSLIYSFQAIEGGFVDDRWAGLAWAAGAGVRSSRRARSFSASTVA